MEPSTIVITLTVTAFVAIGLVFLIQFLIRKHRTIFSNEKVSIRYNNLSKNEVKRVRAWAKNLSCPVIGTFRLLLRKIDRISLSKMSPIDVLITDEVYIGGHRVRAECSASGKNCELEFGSNEYMLKLLRHEIGHSILIMNKTNMSSQEHHELMGSIGF